MTSEPAPTARRNTGPSTAIRPSVGAPLLVAAGTLMMAGWLAAGVHRHTGLAAHDAAVTQWFVEARTPPLTAAAEVVTTLGSEPSITVLSGLLLAWLVVRRRLVAAAHVMACTLLGAALIVGVKHLVARPRPPAYLVSGPPDTTYSFPSGHTLSSTIFFGLAAALVVLATRRRWARAAAVLGWFVASVAVALSRVLLGYHWMTDVLAGWLLGVTVLAVACATWTWHAPPADGRESHDPYPGRDMERAR
ncbi:conserved membrane hypothetical protein [Nostocoides japonicum T1-X7]|uniref:Phosphatidic acid phosphatase type 2/haloperoxidase domain-containing protein n=1 Tax=Nostocoides japonicum T1-X7 TaxID=1194083 RepID=A0A077LT28_9MICO|nr:phosphatase PAP2 family protein [Tetrasphaera japonica]CCH76091.1 conserved membrane hypothetical protein [Tetrasphaera japonica T1-X7]